MHLYPLKFKPILKEKPWGGRRLGDFLNVSLSNKQPVGESIYFSDRPGDDQISVVENGPEEGNNLRTLVENHPEDVLGSKTSPDSFGRFPLLVKFLHAQEKLSLQVHPRDEHAKINENDEGKFEVWYVIEADEDASVVRGLLPDVSPDNLVDAIRQDDPLSVLNCIDVRAGDVILIPPGIVHTIWGGVLLFEVEQNSDVTYRIHDWNRMTPDGSSRELHLNRALDVIDFKAMGRARARPSEVEGPWKKRERLVRTPKFELEKLTIDEEMNEDHPAGSFHLMTVISGSGTFRSGPNRDTRVEYRRGECFLMPARLGDYNIEPDEQSVLLKVSPEKI